MVISLSPDGNCTQTSGQHLDPGEEEQDPDGEQDQSHGKAVGISIYLTKRHMVLASPWLLFLSHA